jgi:hypothetical protein
MKLSNLETAIEVATDCACDLATEDVVGEASVTVGICRAVNSRVLAEIISRWT